MNSHSELSDHELEHLFATSELDTRLFNHEAHLRLAWLFLTRYGTERAIEKFTTQLKIYVTAKGVVDKYNHTLTVAALKVIEHFMKKNNAGSFFEFIKLHPRLKTNFKDLIFSHYRTDLFTSELARKTFLQPDLLAFD